MCISRNSTIFNSSKRISLTFFERWGREKLCAFFLIFVSSKTIFFLQEKQKHFVQDKLAFYTLFLRIYYTIRCVAWVQTSLRFVQLSYRVLNKKKEYAVLIYIYFFMAYYLCIALHISRSSYSILLYPLRSYSVVSSRLIFFFRLISTKTIPLPLLNCFCW